MVVSQGRGDGFEFIQFLKPGAVVTLDRTKPDKRYIVVAGRVGNFSGWRVYTQEILQLMGVPPYSQDEQHLMARFGEWLDDTEIQPLVNFIVRARQEPPTWLELAELTRIRGEFIQAAKDNYELYRDLQKYSR